MGTDEQDIILDRRPPALMAGRSLSAVVAAAMLLLLAGGCTRYEYDVVRPPQLAQHVGTRQWSSLRVEDVEYRLRTSDNRLVMRLYNRGDATIKLAGEDSAAVDSRGESHPLPGRTIPPSTFATLILPPARPYMRSYGPTFGFGAGVGHAGGIRTHHHHGMRSETEMYDGIEPRYYTVYGPRDRAYFEWPGGTELRLILTFAREDAEPLRHEFVLLRRRM